MASTYDHSWRKVRLTILERDGYRCRIKGKNCKGEANDVDHIIPVDRGGERLDPMNLRAACNGCNVARSNRSRHTDGWRRSSAKIVLVVGPVGAGKSTWVRERATVRDIVIDYDDIAKAFGPELPRGAPGGRHGVANAARNAVLRQLRAGKVEANTVWLVSSNPDAENIFPFHHVEVIDPGREQVVTQAADDGRPPSFLRLIDRWYAGRQTGRGTSREW